MGSPQQSLTAIDSHLSIGDMPLIAVTEKPEFPMKNQKHTRESLFIVYKRPVGGRIGRHKTGASCSRSQLFAIWSVLLQYAHESDRWLNIGSQLRRGPQSEN